MCMHLHNCLPVSLKYTRGIAVGHYPDAKRSNMVGVFYKEGDDKAPNPGEVIVVERVWIVLDVVTVVEFKRGLKRP